MTPQFEADVRAAYATLTATMLRIGRDSVGRAVLPKPDVVSQLMLLAAARCGADVAAAVKREKRGLVVRSLAASQLDITPTVALRSAQRLLGRGIDSRATLGAFATSGRTAANKSLVTAADLAALEQELVVQLATLSDEMDAAKYVIAKAWRSSPERLAILADWSQQRRSGT